MTVILAVEPDPRQASRLSSLLRGRRNTEVVIARSAGAAIESIAARVPDVLLTSQLLSPQDETRLADWLKELGPAAAHVQALTIPILAPKATQEQPQRGLLAGLRRRAPKPGPHGCEPKVFAEHVAAYLEKGVVERGDEVIPEVVQAVAEVAPEPVFPEPAAAEVAEPEIVMTEAVVAKPAQPMMAVPAASYDDDEGLWLLTRSPQVIEFGNEPASQDPDTQSFVAVAPPSPPQVLTLPHEVRPVAPFEVVFEAPEVITVRDDGADARALRRSAASTVTVDTAPDTTPPVQDEWGFFDPNKCGFSALLDKLDEITDAGRHSTAEVDASVRIVSHY